MTERPAAPEPALEQRLWSMMMRAGCGMSTLRADPHFGGSPCAMGSQTDPLAPRAFLEGDGR